MNDHRSITRVLSQFQTDDGERRDRAAARVWREYFPRLLALARKQLDDRLRQRLEPEDIVQSAYKSFCMRQQQGQFELDGRDDLWRLLVHITLQKARNAAKRETRHRRDARREQGANHGQNTDSRSPVWLFERLEGRDPTPDEAAAFSEEVQRRLDTLPDAAREVALLKLQGHTNEEIASADHLDCAVRTVERKLAIIRKRWSEALEQTNRDPDGRA